MVPNYLKNIKLAYIKSYLIFFLRLLDSKKDRAAIRFLFRHTTFHSIRKGKMLFQPNTLTADGNILIITEGLVNGFLSGPTLDKLDIWLGSSGSTYICDDFNTDYTFNLFAIEDTILLFINKAELEKGYIAYPALDSLINLYLLHNALADVNNRNILFRLQSTESKISLFRRIYPGLYERLPSDLLLSYLYTDVT